MQESTRESVLPPIAIGAFLVSVAGAGALANCAVVAALLKRARNGIFAITIQLCIADFLLGASLLPEIWSWNTQTWQFGSCGCSIYQGLKVFTTTSTVYLVAILALHSLSTIDLEKNFFDRRIKRAGRDEDELRSSCHSLVADSDTSTPPRTMNVDYRLTVTRVSATLPTIFVWVLSASLSIPEFVLSLIVHTDKVVVCNLESTHRMNIYTMLAVFTLFLPFFIMSSTAVLIFINLNKNIPAIESKASLKLSLWLILSYGMFCAPRSVMDIYSVYLNYGSESSLQLYNPPRSDKSALVNLCVSSVCLLSVVVRPLLYVITLPQLKKQLIIGSKSRNDV